MPKFEAKREILQKFGRTWGGGGATVLCILEVIHLKFNKLFILLQVLVKLSVVDPMTAHESIQ